jgi:hypothetical protein
MRFYDFQIFNNDNTPYYFQGAGVAGSQPPILAHWTSLGTDGNPDPGALNIEFDIPIFNATTTTADAALTLWGAGLAVISQASNLFGSASALKKVLLSVGMSKGLPLANPGQHGSPLSFSIIQAYGNWQGVNQTLNLRLTAATTPPPASPATTPSNTPAQAAPTPVTAPTAATGSASTNRGLLAAVAVTPYAPLNPTAPVNIQFHWTQGETLTQAVQNTLLAAYPGAALFIAISSGIVAYVSMDGYYQTLQQFAAAISNISIRYMNSTTYQGVRFWQRGNAIFMDDSTNATTVSAGQTATATTPANASAASAGNGTKANPFQIQFTDLVGQPVWINIATIQFTTVMRADINVRNYILMPKNAQALTTSTASSQSALRNNTVFQGAFLVTSVRIVGNFRNPSAESWLTVFTAVDPSGGTLRTLY